MLYAKNRMDGVETALLQSYALYVCGSELFVEPHALRDKVFIRMALTCAMPVESLYYQSRKFEMMCCWCCTKGGNTMVDTFKMAQSRKAFQFVLTV